MNKNGEKTKLLAAVAVLAMIMCVFAVALPAADAAAISGDEFLALDENEDGVIDLDADVTVSSVITVTGALTINGNDHTITADSSWTGDDNGTKNIISINRVAGKVVLNDVTFVGASGVNVWDSDDVTLNNVTVKGSEGAGLTVGTNSVATVNESSFSNNEWGDINVDKAATLNIDDATELTSNFQIWSEDVGENGSTINADSYVAYKWVKTGTTEDGRAYFKNGATAGDLTVGSKDTLIIGEKQILVVNGKLTTTGTLTNNGIVITVPTANGLTASVSGNNVVFSGEVLGVNTNDSTTYTGIEGNYTFDAVFGNTYTPAGGSETHETPWGYAFFQIDGLNNISDDAKVAIEQSNEALMFYQGKSVDGTIADGVKLKTYGSDDCAKYAMLVPKDVDDMNVKISVFAVGTNGDKTGTALVTYSFDFSGVTTASKLDSSADKDAIDAAFDQNDVVYIENTTAVSDLAVPENKTLVASNIAAVDNVTVNKGSEIVVESETGISISTAVTVPSADGSSVTLCARGEGVAAFTADSVRFYYGSSGIAVTNAAGGLVFNGDGKIQGSVSGNMTINFKDEGADVVVDGELALADKVTLTIGPGVTLNVGDYVTVVEGATATIAVSNGATLVYSELPENVAIKNNGGTVKIDGAQGTENIISISQSVNGTYYLTGDTTILSGVTLTVPRNATLDLMGYELTVEGTLAVENRGVVTSTVGTDGAIVLASSGAIQNSGIIGDKMPIKVSNGTKATADEQYVEMQGVTGVSFQLVRSIENGQRVYDMAVSGDVSKVTGADEYTLEIMNVDINADMTIGTDVAFTVSGATEIESGVTLTNSGKSMTIAGSNASLKVNNGATVIIDAMTVGTITVVTGTVGDNNVITGTSATVVFADDAEDDYVTGMTITADRVTIPSTTGKATVEQRVYVSGDLAAKNDDSKKDSEDIAAAVSFTGTIYVDGTLAIPESVTVNGAFDVSEAGIVTSVNNDSIVYSGAKYSVEVDKDTETYYYTNFADAMANIATAVDETVYIDGKYTITGTFEVADGQSVELEGTSADITVGSNGIITVAEDGYVAPAAFKLIEGKVIVLAGTGYVPTADAGIYAVVTVDAETEDTTYSGFKLALDEAVSGQTITMVDNATYRGNMVVPNGVTVVVEDNLTLTVTGNVTVEQGGKLTLGMSTLKVGSGDKSATVTVAGELDAVNGGSFAVGGKDVSIYSTGTLATNGAISVQGVNVNSAYYNDGGEYTYTSLANAVAYAMENALVSVNVCGTFSESGSVTSEGVDIVVDDGAKVTLGTIVMTDAQIGPAENADVEYSATVSALSGEGAAAVTSTVTVSKTDATIVSEVTLTSAGENDYALTIDGFKGATTVSAGTVTYIGDAIATTKDTNTVTVSGGATLLINSESTVDITGQYLLNEGTVQIDSDVIVNGKDNTNIVKAVLSGNYAVSKDGTMVMNGTVAVTGTLTIDDEGSLTVNDVLEVGETPRLLGQTATGEVIGKILIADGDSVVVFAGASVAQAQIVNSAGEDAESTAFSINGVAFAAVYALGSVRNNTVDDYVYALKDLATLDENKQKIDIVWMSGETDASDASIGEYEAVSAEIAYGSVVITVSAGSQITIAIDGVVVPDYAALYGYAVTIGTHTVTATVNPGYSGEVTITFNGQEITNGQFTVTSEMLESINPIVLSASGNITQDSTVVVNHGESGETDSGMGITDYLLIVLVVLIVIMAIIVAMRLMRS